MSLQAISAGAALVAIASMLPKTNEAFRRFGDAMGDAGRAMMTAGIALLPPKRGPLAQLVEAEAKIADEIQRRYEATPETQRVYIALQYPEATS